MWKINPDSDQYLMFCEQDSLCYIDQQSLEKIQEFEKKNKNNNKKLTFYKHQNGYILCSAINLYIHQVIMDCYGNGSGTKNITVDHIDKDPLNNRFNNLIIIDSQEKREKKLEERKIEKERVIRERKIEKEKKKEEINKLRQEQDQRITDTFKQFLKESDVIIDISKGTLVDQGKYSNQYKNKICHIQNIEKNDEYLMLCNQNKVCKICPISLKKIIDYEKKLNNNKKIIWSYHLGNGYIIGNNNLYIHQVIMDCYGNGSGTKNISVDHIDRDPLNNRFDNLRIASRIEQENNSKGIQEGTKRERKHNAQPLPEGITQDMLKKYVVYYRECYNKDKQLFREFFRVESHPKQTKEWIGTKSEKVTILDKLKAANLYVTQLNSDTLPEDTAPKLPLYINIQNFRQKPHLVFDRRLETGGRQNLKMVLPNDYNLEEQLTKFQAKIDQKYPPEVS